MDWTSPKEKKLDETVAAWLASQQTKSAAPIVMPPMDIQAKLPSAKSAGIGGSGPPLPSVPPDVAAPRPAQSMEDKGLVAAQDLAAQNRLWAGLGRAGATMAAGLNRQKVDSAPWDAMDASSDQSVKDYVQRKGAVDEKRKRAEADALKDPLSPQSIAFQARVGKLMPGMYSPEDLKHLSASDSDQILSYGKMRSDLDERKAEAGERARASLAGEAHQSAQEAQAAAALRQQGSLAYAQMKNAKDIADANNATDLAKAAAAKNAAATPLPPEAIKVANQLEAVKGLVRLKRAHDETNGFGGVATSIFPGNTASNRYHDAVNADSSVLAAGILPQGRETPGAVEMIHNMVPGAMTGSSRAAAQFRSHRDNILGNARSQIQTIAASGKYDKGQIAELNRQLAAAEEAGKSLDEGGSAGTGKVRVSNGKETLDIDPSDVAHAAGDGFKPV